MEFIDLKTQYSELRTGIDRRIQTVLDHGHYIMGPEVAELEERLAAYTGAKHCITVSSGTEALLISLMAIGVGPGDEVITSPFSFIATAEVIVLLGAKPVFADIDRHTCNINASLIEEKVTDRTRAIIPVSLYGQPADMNEINLVAKKHGLVVIEDGAQSFGSSYKGRKSGNLSAIGCTSFFPSKPLGCYGDGGAIFTSDLALAEAMREIRVHGQSQRYRHTRIGVGGRMDTLQCAIVLAKFEHFEWELQQRQRVAELYDLLFDGKIDRVSQCVDRTSAHAQYTICLPDRDEIRDELARMQIPTAIHYPVPIPLQPAYAGLCDCDPRQLPVSLEKANTVLSLPMGPYLDERSVRQVVDAMLDAASRRQSIREAIQQT